MSAGALDAGCGDRVLTSRISRDGYPTCGRRPGDRRQRGRRPFGCGVRCPGQGHMPRRVAIRGLLTTLNSPPSTHNPRNSQPSTHHPDGRILQYVPHTGQRYCQLIASVLSYGSASAGSGGGREGAAEIDTRSVHGRTVQYHISHISRTCLVISLGRRRPPASWRRPGGRCPCSGCHGK